MFKLEELRGVLPALVTPMREDGSVDRPAIGSLVEHVLAGGVHGLLPLGSTGETASLDEPSRRQVLEAVMEAAAGRVPVICGVAQTHLAAARAEVAAAARLGALAVLVAPPFYYPVDQATVLGFYRRLAADSQLPLLVYNIPQFTKLVIEPDTLETLAREGVVAGIKDSSRDFEYLERVCLATRDLPRFRIFTGSDTMLLPSLVMGAAGTICGGANVAPSWPVRIFEAFERQDWAAARADQDLLLDMVLAVRAGVFPAAIKAALHLMGVCGPWPAPPVPALDEAGTRRLGEQLQAWGLLAAVGSSQR